ncbi:Protein of unknown function, partial [Gryllus bimaculatus]
CSVKYLIIFLCCKFYTEISQEVFDWRTSRLKIVPKVRS